MKNEEIRKVIATIQNAFRNLVKAIYEKFLNKFREWMNYKVNVQEQIQKRKAMYMNWKRSVPYDTRKSNQVLCNKPRVYMPKGLSLGVGIHYHKNLNLFGKS
ncbi:hypothetical protein AS180_05320 [Priestia veravalensis]|uniref:Uncharacterized protein n=1 Tax=Priestia veravalensis TaxID=1414648 RepID=A0A0V8JPL8_9BACI|nr:MULTISPECIES: hypothetical protein [Priestia]KSU88918.1 hypothetical protein AS180_05320 [Priestia veravalensis]SCC03008.1 hypothetical protein GA0061087_100853 [Priestia flexa]